MRNASSLTNLAIVVPPYIYILLDNLKIVNDRT
nr:MAG TPA: hypothetical protein [Caudoviricetes sp.]